MCFSVENIYSTLQVAPPLPSPFVIHTLCNTTEGNYWLGANNSFQRIALSCVPQWKIHQDNSLFTAYPPTRSLQSEMNCLVTYSNAASGKMFDFFFFIILSEQSSSGAYIYSDISFFGACTSPVRASLYIVITDIIKNSRSEEYLKRIHV